MPKPNSDKMNKLAIVIPVYNESQIISTVINDWITCLNNSGIPADIHLYNDGSTDNTLDELAAFKNNDSVFIHDKQNSGHGPTILKGYRDNSSYEWIFQIDSDNEMSPDNFEQFWIKRSNYDILLGSRSQRSQTFIRKMISLVSRLSIRIFYGSGIWDVNAPYRLMRGSVLSNQILRIPTDTFAPNVIISGLMCKENRRVMEIPLPHNERTTGEVSLRKFRLFMAAFKSFLQIILFRIKYL